MSGQDTVLGLAPRVSVLLRVAALCAACAATASCALLPRSGPLASELDPGAPEGVEEGLVILVDAAVAMRVNRPPRRGFPPAFLTAPAIDTARLGVGDAIDILIWEPGGDGLFGVGDADVDGATTGAALLPSVRVDTNGNVFVPFLGDIRAAGLSPGELRARIRDGLAPLSAAPEVDVRLRSVESRVVTVQGAVVKPGRLVLERGFATLVPALALAGGSREPVEQIEVSVRRNGATGAAMLADVYGDPALDIALLPGDAIILNPIRERFVVMGATVGQGEVVFPTRELNLLAALAAAAGLRDFDANPQGLFVLRLEDRAVADALLLGPPPPALAATLVDAARRPIIYRFDLTNAASLFAAQGFLMRDGDVLLAANAPLTELRKLLQIFTAVLTPVQQSTAISAL